MFLLEMFPTRCRECCKRDFKSLNHKHARFMALILDHMRGQVILMMQPTDLNQNGASARNVAEHSQRNRP
jgi:hypothetical protein